LIQSAQGLKRNVTVLSSLPYLVPRCGMWGTLPPYTLRASVVVAYHNNNNNKNYYYYYYYVINLGTVHWSQCLYIFNDVGNSSRLCNIECVFFFLWLCSPTRAMASSFTRFLDHTQRRATVGRTPLDEWSARCRDLYLTTHNTHSRQTSMPPVGLEPTIAAGERP
jgi:hypothetical protein